MGIRAVAGARAAVVMLADMPFVTPDMLRTLLARYRESAPPLVVSRYGEVTAPPILYDRVLFPELEAYEGEGCGKHDQKYRLAGMARGRLWTGIVVHGTLGRAQSKALSPKSKV